LWTLFVELGTKEFAAGHFDKSTRQWVVHLRPDVLLRIKVDRALTRILLRSPKENPSVVV
jgi:hypothetical protein